MYSHECLTVRCATMCFQKIPSSFAVTLHVQYIVPVNKKFTFDDHPTVRAFAFSHRFSSILLQKKHSLIPRASVNVTRKKNGTEERRNGNGTELRRCENANARTVGRLSNVNFLLTGTCVYTCSLWNIISGRCLLRLGLPAASVVPESCP